MAGAKKRRRGSKDKLWLRGRIWWTNVGGERVSTGCTDREAARLARGRLEREAADPAHAASRQKSVGDMIAATIADRANAPGRRGGTLAPESLEIWRTKLGHVGRVLGLDTPMAEVDYAAVGRFLDQRHAEGASQHTRHKELSHLRFGLRLMKQAGAYPHDVDYVTRTRRFAKGYVPRKRHLTWEQIPALLSALLMRHADRVSPDVLARAKAQRAAGVMVKDIAAELGVAPTTVTRYLTLDPKPTPEAHRRAQHMAWLIAAAGRRKESFFARREDHDLANWTVALRGTKTAKAERTIPIAPPFRPLLVFALAGRPARGLLFGKWDHINRSLSLACARAGIEHLSPNDLRRTHSSLMRQGGIALEDIAAILGHSTTRMVELVYGHTTMKALHKSVGRLEAPEHEIAPDPSTILSRPRGEQ